MYVLYVDSVWNNDENSLLIRGKIKIKLKNKKTVNFHVDTIKYVYYNVKKEINNMNSVFDQL